MLKPRIAALALVLCGALQGAPSHADDYEDAERLYRQGNRNAALGRLDKALEARPRDARARFLKGVILADQNRTADAIQIFTELTQDFPELPEPHNNLAVLYAGQGEYEKAREALEMAIRTHPSYATAHENLGDIYAQLASQAYDKALQLDRDNKTARTKLALIREIVPAQGAQLAAGEAAAPEPRTPPPAPAAPPTGAVPSVPATPAPPASQTDASAAAPAPAEPSTPAERTKEVVKMVEDWTRAWSNADIDAYLAFYAPDFRTPSGETRQRWEAARRKRLAAPSRISVTAVSPTVQFTDASHASVTFRQNYTSDTLNVTGRKTLRLVRDNGRWLIQQETVHR